MLQSYSEQTKSPQTETDRLGYHTTLIVLTTSIALLIAIALPMLQNSYPIAHSTQYNLSWAFQYQRQFFGGQFYPRWLEFSNFGFGNATFVFYPPICMVATLPWRMLGFDMPASLVGSMVLAIAVLGLGLYRYARRFYPKWAALLVTHLGMLSPYLLLDVYHRGALGETWAIAFLPWILLAIQWVIDRPQSRQPILFLALTYGLLALSHLPALLIFTILLLPMPWLVAPSVAVLTDAAPTLQSWRSSLIGGARTKAVWRCYGGIVLGLGWTGFFIFPVLFDQHYIQLHALTETPEYQAHHRLMLDGLLALHPQLPTHWFETGSGLIPAWWLFVGVFVLGLASWAIASRQSISTEEEAIFRRSTLYWLLVVAFALLMTTDLLKWVYLAIPFLDRLQFSWRWLGIVVIMLPMLCGSILIRVIPGTYENRSEWGQIAIAGVLAVVLSGSLWLSHDVWKRTVFDPNLIRQFTQLTAQKQYPFEPDTAQKGEPIFWGWHWIYPDGIALGDVPEYRAQGVMLPLPPEHYNYPFVLLNEGDATRIKIPHWDFGYRQFFVDSPNGDRPYTLELRTFYYPGWQVEIDGVSVPTAKNGKGQIIITLQPGKHQIDVTYAGTPAEWLGLGITFFTLGGLVGRIRQQFVRSPMIPELTAN